MGRTHLVLPDRFPFSTEILIQVSHINYGGHLGNDAVLSLIHEARIRFLKSLGYAENDIEGVGLIMVDAAVVYKSEAFHGEAIRIDVGVQDFTKHGCDIFYRLTETTTGREVARSKTTVVFFDYTTRKKARTPEKFKSIFTS